jgi:hypothetical protein
MEVCWLSSNNVWGSRLAAKGASELRCEQSHDRFGGLCWWCLGVGSSMWPMELLAVAMGTHCVQGESRQRFAGEGSSGVGLKLIARKGGNQKKRCWRWGVLVSQVVFWILLVLFQLAKRNCVELIWYEMCQSIVHIVSVSWVPHTSSDLASAFSICVWYQLSDYICYAVYIVQCEESEYGLQRTLRK